MDLKNTKELIDGLKLVGINGKKAFKDGININDLQYLLQIANNFKVLSAAIDGIGDVPKEVKDLSGDEVQELVAHLLLAINEIKNA